MIRIALLVLILTAATLAGCATAPSLLERAKGIPMVGQPALSRAVSGGSNGWNDRAPYASLDYSYGTPANASEFLAHWANHELLLLVAAGWEDAELSQYDGHGRPTQRCGESCIITSNSPRGSLYMWADLNRPDVGNGSVLVSLDLTESSGKCVWPHHGRPEQCEGLANPLRGQVFAIFRYTGDGYGHPDHAVPRGMGARLLDGDNLLDPQVVAIAPLNDNLCAAFDMTSEGTFTIDCQCETPPPESGENCAWSARSEPFVYTGEAYQVIESNLSYICYNRFE